MKAYLVNTEDGETQYFSAWEDAEEYCLAWVKDYVSDDSTADLNQIRKEIGPWAREINIR